MPNWATAERYVNGAKPELVTKIPWETASYKLPLGGKEGFQRFGPKKFFVGTDGSFYFSFSKSIYKFSNVGTYINTISDLGGFIDDVEIYPNKGFGVLLEKQRPYKKTYFAARLSENFKISNKATLKVQNVDGDEHMEFSDGSIYQMRNGKRVKLHTAIDLNDNDRNLCLIKNREYTPKELVEKGELIIKSHKSKLYAMIDVYLGEMKNSEYFRMLAVHGGKYEINGVLVINGSGDFQYAFTPPRKTYFGEACYWVLPTVDKNGDVFYLYNDADSIFVYRWPVRW
jgi:hypothetical protein